MKRRTLLVAATALPLAGLVHAAEPRRIGLIMWHGGLMARKMSGGTAFLAAMKELGYTEGRDFVYEEKLWQKQEEAPDMVRDLVRRKVDLIIAAGPPSIVAVNAVTNRVPVIMMYSAEPVAMGLVQSLNRPGGNITGLTWDHGFETNLKALELLKEVLPRMRRVALIWDKTDPVHPVYAKHYERAAPQIGVELVSSPVGRMEDVEPAFARMRAEKADALVILPSGQLTLPQRKEILAMAVRDRLPTLFAYIGRDFPGAILHHGPNLDNMPRRAAAYASRILKGAKPADLPIEQPERYDVVIDLGAARKLGISVPNSILVRADRVIQ